MRPSPEVIGNAGQATPGPRVSIITPSLNQAPFIRATIESVLAQDYPRIEYLVLDGGSTDGALEVIREYEGRLDWICEKDSGQANALNRGFRRVHGEIVAWLNSDDVLLPGAVSAMVECFTAQPEVALVYGDGYLMDVEGNVIREMHLGEPNLWDLMHLYGHMMLGAAIFYRADALASVGYLDESWHWQFDYDLYLRLCARYPYAHLPTQVAGVRVYLETLSQSGGVPRYRELRRILRTYSVRPFPPSTPYYLADLVQLNLAGLKEKRATAPRRAAIASSGRHGMRTGEAGGVPPGPSGARRRLGGTPGRVRPACAAGTSRRLEGCCPLGALEPEVADPHAWRRRRPVRPRAGTVRADDPL